MPQADGPMVRDMQGTSSGGSEPDNFMEIWGHNLEEGFEKIRRVVFKFPYVAMVCINLQAKMCFSG